VPTTSSTGGGLTEALRGILKDTNFLSRQFDFTVTSGATALVSVIEGALVITATVSSPTFQFSQYPTIAQLVEAINEYNAAFRATLVEDADPDHTTEDLQLFPPTTALNKRVVFSSRMWSDDELDAMIGRAINRHNNSIPADPTLKFRGNYNITSLPSEHEYYVLLLAQIEALKVQIQSATKRKGSDLTVTDFVALKGALEKEYADQLKLFMARRVTLTPTDVKDLGSGDVIEGQTYRESLHTGRHYPYGPRMVPSSAAPKPVAVHLNLTALGSGQALLQWTFNRDPSFHRYEVWRGTTAAVSDISELITTTATGIRVTTRYYREQVMFIDGAATPLTPGTYYYVVYVFNKNNEGTPSNVAIVTVT
jgi:hypothetical protein